MIVAGFGFRSSAVAASLLDALAATAKQPTHLAAPQDKADAQCMQEVSERLQLPVIPITNSQLSDTETVTQSPIVIEARGIGSVAEAAALAGAGLNATLAGPRSISADRLATCAIAVGAST